ncbi:MAG: phage scaffolding protein [Clostridia bacterium]|nr:phage scaffolding protein [Clostridia bacterium]
MKKEEIMELIPELSEEDAEALSALWEEELLKEKESFDAEKIREEARCEAYEQARNEYLEKQRDMALEDALEKANSKSTKTLKALINMEELGFEDGQITGLSQQIEKLREECGFLFFDEEEKPKFTNGSASFENKLDLSGLSYKERLKLYSEMPEVYQRLVK